MNNGYEDIQQREERLVIEVEVTHLFFLYPSTYRMSRTSW